VQCHRVLRLRTDDIFTWPFCRGGLQAGVGSQDKAAREPRATRPFWCWECGWRAWASTLKTLTFRSRGVYGKFRETTRGQECGL